MRRVWLWLLLLAAVLAYPPPVAAQEPPVVQMRLTDVSGVPMGGVEVQFFYENGQGGGSCVTDAGGCCEIVLPSGGGLIRGYLVVGEAGRRSLIWPGGTIVVDLRIQADGTLYVPTGVEDAHPEDLPQPLRGEGNTEVPTVFPQFPTPVPSSFPSPTPPVLSPTPVRSESATPLPSPSGQVEPVAPDAPASGAAGEAGEGETAAAWVEVVIVVLAAAGLALLAWGVWSWRRG